MFTKSLSYAQSQCTAGGPVSSNAMDRLIEIHEEDGGLWTLLHIGQGQEPNLQSRADRLAPVGSAQLPKDVVKVRLD